MVKIKKCKKRMYLIQHRIDRCGWIKGGGVYEKLPFRFVNGIAFMVKDVFSL